MYVALVPWRWIAVIVSAIFIAIAPELSPDARAASYKAIVLFRPTLPTGFLVGSLSGRVGTAAGGQLVGYGEGAVTDGSDHALLFSEPTGIGIDLNPSGFSSSHAAATNGSKQVGSGISNIDGANHALLWSGTVGSAIDLNPLTFLSSQATATDGFHQVGFGANPNSPGNSTDALLWSGSSNTFIDLNPTGWGNTVAYGVSGSQQVGTGFGSANAYHALLWTGSPTQFTDLNPSGYSSSTAFATDGSKQVGYGTFSGDEHALLWSSSSTSFVDLNPSGFYQSQAYAINGKAEVGYGDKPDNTDRALLWTGNAGSVVDLSQSLPVDGSWSSSKAYSIDIAGNVFGTAGGTYNGHNSTFAVEWVLQGDFNRDGHVTASDISAMMKALTDPSGYKSQYGVTTTELSTIGDLNGDGQFGNADLQKLLNLLKSGGGSTSVPEPASYILLMFGALGLLRRKSIRISRAAIVQREQIERLRAPGLRAHPLD